MQGIHTLQKYENWKKAKKRRKAWFWIISFFVGLILAYITGNLICKVGLFKTKKLFSYAYKKEAELKPTNQSNLPNDYVTWFKDLKESTWYRKIFDKENKESYWTREEIAKREAKKAGKDALGEIGEWLGEWFGSSHLTEEQKKEVDYNYWAHHVYSSTVGSLIILWIIFWIIYSQLLRWIVLPLCWKEPVLVEEE